MGQYFNARPKGEKISNGKEKKYQILTAMNLLLPS